MKKFILSLVVFLAVLPYGYYQRSDGLFIYTYLHSWPDNWSLVSVEPAL